MNILKKLWAVIFLSIILLITGATQAAEAAPPANFQTTPIVTTGLNGPSGFEIAPDGRIFVLERTGKIKIVKNGVLLPEPFADLPSAASGDRGLIGIAFDPEFGTANHYVYFYYTGVDKLNRLVRYDASSDIGQNGPFLLYQTTSPSEELHVGGSIAFGPDGKLYFAVGDNGYPPNAQNLGNPHGKILRINKDGSIPLDNPFVGQPGALPEIWAYGMRNPWRFQFDSVTGLLYGVDVGDYTWEEVNLIQKGKNYGWPAIEGPCTTVCNGYTDPIYPYNHNGLSSAVTGGPVYRGEMFPDEYRGSLFIGDYAQGFIKQITLDSAGNATGVIDFDPNAGSVVDLKVAPDGSMYFITYFPGRLYQVTYSTGNKKPTANATADDEKGVEPHTVQFSSEGSSDPDGDPITYLWDFGDGATSTEANPVHTYVNKGTYTVELAVSDGTNTVNAIPVVIQVGIPPSVNISVPLEGDTYKAGQTINYNAFANDGAGFDINDADIKTEVFLHHNTHFHPLFGPFTGRAGQFTIPTIGEPSADTWHEIRVTATDTNGLSTTKSVNIYPLKSNITLETVPAGLQINVDGIPRTATFTMQGVVDFRRELFAPTTQVKDGKVYQFERWADNQAQKHFIATQPTDTTYTAIYKESPAFAAEYFNNTTLAGSPVLTRNDAVIDFSWGGGSPDPILPNDQFSARWTKEQYFAAGTYKFVTATDDGVRLYVDNQLVIDEWYGNNQSFNATVALTQGEHEIRMEYFEDSGGAQAKLTWDVVDSTTPPPSTGGYTGEYFNNTALSGQPVLTRDDAVIDFDWGIGKPDPVVDADQFSVRWTKTAAFTAGTYEFTVTADDGVRLYVDDELLIDKWIDQGTTTYKATKVLTDGSHTVRVEYYENGWDAVAKFSYVKTSDTTPPPTTAFSGEYFANKTLSGTPVLVRTDESVNFDWGGGSPAGVVPNDNFSARWTKSELFEDGDYEFTVTADDGVRLYIDGELILDKWIDQAPTTYKATKTLTAGNHTILLTYFETGGGATAALSYAKTGGGTTPPPSSGYAAEYFNNITLTAPAAILRNEAVINFDWGGGSPGPTVNANNFSARFTKTETFEDGVYAFRVTADDGIRVMLDGVTIIDQWKDQSPTTYTVEVPVTAGERTIVVEYYENSGGAVAKMSYAKIDDGTPTPPPTDVYQAKYWNLSSGDPFAIPLTQPTLTREDAEINFDWGGESPDPVINPNRFVTQWIKQQIFEEGTYTFTTVSDDGIRVYIDNELVIDQWNDHAPMTHTGEKILTAGNHEIKVEYYENGGGAVAKFSFEKVGGSTPPPTGQQSINFDDKAGQDQVLSGEYPAGIINWGTDVWWHSGPWGLFTTKSISFNGAGITSGAFSFLSPKKLVRLDAYNGGATPTTVIISCAGNTDKVQLVDPGQKLTIETGFTTACTSVTISSTNGWDTNFDNLVIE